MANHNHSNLNAIQKWLDHVDQITVPTVAGQGISVEEKQQLQTVNRAIEQLKKVGVTVPSELRSLKLSISSKEMPDPLLVEHIAALEALIKGLGEVVENARKLLNKLNPKAKDLGGTKKTNQKFFGVTLKQLLDFGFLSPEDRLRHRSEKGNFEAKVSRDGSLSAKTDQGWKTFDSLSKAAAAVVNRRGSNGWQFWRRVNGDGTLISLRKIRDEYLDQIRDEDLNQTNDS